jgi:hypothetical protein
MIGEQVAQTAIFYKGPEALPSKCLCVVTAATPGERDSYLGPRGRYKPDWTARECAEQGPSLAGYFHLDTSVLMLEWKDQSLV